MSRLADYFVIVGYDHEKESKLRLLYLCLLCNYWYLNRKWY